MEQTKEISPAELMEDFRGRSLKKIIIFTLAAHLALFLMAAVVPYAWGLVAGPDVKELTEEERMELAVKRARASLTEIAKDYGLNSPDALSSQLAGGARPASKAEVETPETPTSVEGGEEPGEPKSAIEEEINKVAPGPEVPPIPEEEDLFK